MGETVKLFVMVIEQNYRIVYGVRFELIGIFVPTLTLNK